MRTVLLVLTVCALAFAVGYAATVPSCSRMDYNRRYAKAVIEYQKERGENIRRALPYMNAIGFHCGRVFEDSTATLDPNMAGLVLATYQMRVDNLMYGAHMAYLEDNSEGKAIADLKAAMLASLRFARGE